MDDNSRDRLTLARRFLEPSNSTHRQYEALRAFFVDGVPSAEAAARFGYTPGSFRVLVHPRLWPLQPRAWLAVSETAAISCVVAPAYRRPGSWRRENTRGSWGNTDPHDSRRRIAIGADDPNPIL